MSPPALAPDRKPELEVVLATCNGAAFLDARVVVEPGGAVGLAAVLSGKLAGSAKNICVVMSGGNIDRTLFADILTG